MKTVLITGATSGIGYEFAKLYNKKNYKLVLVSRPSKKIDKLKKEFKNALVISKDLTEKNACESVYKKVKKQKIKVDILINNAGFGLKGSFLKTDINTEVNMIKLNITALVKLTKLFAKDMKPGSRIMNVGSIAGFMPGPNMSIYYATKAFVYSFSRALRRELKKKNISVSVLCPGPTKTEFEKRAKTNFGDDAMSAKDVAEIGHREMMKNKHTIIPGWKNKVNYFLLKIMPTSFVLNLVEGFHND